MVAADSIKIPCICEACSRRFFVYPAVLRQRTPRCCSSACWQSLRDVLTRFWEKVQVCEHGLLCETCCWLWTGTRRKRDGYGKFCVGTREGKPLIVLAHRFMWHLMTQEYAKKWEVCHNCPTGDNPGCVNFHHHWLGDQRANVLDAAAKGRMAVGDRNGTHTHPERRQRGATHYNVKISEEIVRKVRAAVRAGQSQRHVARELNLNYKHVWKIVHYFTWAHIPEEVVL